MLPSKTESDLYFERIAEELEKIADAIDMLQSEDRDLAARLQRFAEQIRRDSGLTARAERRKAG